MIILDLNSYLKYGVDEDAEIRISIEDLFDIIQEARPQLYNAATADCTDGETSMHDFGRILDSIVYRCAVKSPKVNFYPRCSAADDDADNGAEGSDTNPTNEEGEIWRDPA